MKHVTCSALALFSLIICSCDSPELTQKRDKQLLEISKLRGELSLVEEKLKTIPADRSDDLAQIETDAKAQQAEVKKLEAEVAELEAKKAALEKDFAEYKSKYVIR
jgi:septal ring factor EnvC (AmiA/AmiB activator)